MDGAGILTLPVFKEKSHVGVVSDWWSPGHIGLCFSYKGAWVNVFRVLSWEPGLTRQDFLHLQNGLSVGAVQPGNVTNVPYREAIMVLLPNYIFTSPKLHLHSAFSTPIEQTLE